ncbi:SPASM domain-containing protein [Kribbella sp. NPDC050820]|uniref:SPASM domain-containing protein n=1 Tax=Kribbella sp. NPDC050820 TaxID=3155408 RepID=UPI0033C8A54E
MDQLCGQCASKVLAISPTGEVWPCVFSRWLPVGNVKTSSLGEVVSGSALRDIRSDLAEEFARRAASTQPCVPNMCDPQCGPSCGPACRPHCWPTGQGPCKPKGGWGEDVGPVQVAVHGRPVLDVDRCAVHARGAFPGPVRVDAHSGGLGVLQRRERGAEVVPPGVGQFGVLFQVVGGRDRVSGQQDEELGPLAPPVAVCPLHDVEHPRARYVDQAVGVDVARPGVAAGPLRKLRDDPQPVVASWSGAPGADGAQPPSEGWLAGDVDAEVLRGLLEVHPHPLGEPGVRCRGLFGRRLIGVHWSPRRRRQVR